MGCSSIVVLQKILVEVIDRIRLILKKLPKVLSTITSEFLNWVAAKCRWLDSGF